MAPAYHPLTIVTGGSRGIGAATAIHLAGLGHDVVLGYLTDHSSASQVVAAARATGANAIAVPGDITDENAVAVLFDAAAELGTVTGLVNNAGLTAHIGDLADTPIDVMRRVVEVNLLGALLCARRAAQVLSTARGGPGGAIVNVSSAAATLGSAHEYVHYAAAKAGVEALTVGLAKELADQGVRVNAVAPGIVRTDIHAAAGDPNRLQRIVPASRWEESLNPARSLPPSPGSWGPKAATSPAPASAWPAGYEHRIVRPERRSRHAPPAAAGECQQWDWVSEAGRARMPRDGGDTRHHARGPSRLEASFMIWHIYGCEPFKRSWIVP